MIARMTLCGYVREGWTSTALDRHLGTAYGVTLRSGALRRVALLMYAKTMSAATAAVLFSLVAIDGATAEGGCGPSFHRNEFGRCRPNRPVVVVPGAPVVVAPAAPA
jgi:hypothetical protein